MEKRLNRKINAHTQSFKNDIKTKMQTLGLLDDYQCKELLQYIYDYPVTEITKIDLQKRKRVKNSVPYNERCCALRANNEQCTRRKKSGEKFCGTHIKGTPHGEIKVGEQVADTTVKIEQFPKLEGRQMVQVFAPNVSDNVNTKNEKISASDKE